MKHLPLALATVAIVATQIACTFAITRSRHVDELFVDHVQQVVYDGEVIRVDLGRKWVSNADGSTGPSLDKRVVGHLVLTREATAMLNQHLARLLVR